MFGIGGGELVLVLFIALLVFGATGLPEIGKGLGKAIKEFKKAGKELRGDIEESIKDDDDEKKK
ncbi:MAG: twin-arginine translocase TatA/TatE family subunit [Nitrospinae bacterium]|nr:twin-arginine translocase TatA/TatE family subunit [Nitrospinota bacterium]